MIVLTGGAGFIGTNTLEALNGEGVTEVLVVDDIRSSRKWRHLSGRALRDYVPRADFPDRLEALDGDAVEGVIHLGACTDTTEEDFDYLARVNLRYSQRIWAWCAERGVPLVYASSGATYGDGSQGFSDRRESPGELAELAPLNPYGLSKHLFDLWAVAQEEAPPRWAGLKFFNVYGPHEAHKGKMASYVHQAIAQARDEGRVRLFESHRPDFGDGEQRRDFVWVGDVVEVVLRALDGAVPSGLYNVGTGEARSFNELVEAIFEALGEEPRVEYFEMPPEIRDKYQYFTEAETAKLEATGAAPDWTPLEEGVRRLVEAGAEG